MSKSSLLSISLFVSMCLIAPFAFGTLPFTMPAAKPKPAPTIALPVLAPQDFIDAVDSNNAQVQKGLDATLTKLVGAPATAPAPAATPTSNVPADTSNTATTSTTQTPAPSSTPSSTTPSTPSSTGTFNPYRY